MLLPEVVKEVKRIFRILLTTTIVRMHFCKAIKEKENELGNNSDNNSENDEDNDSDDDFCQAHQKEVADVSAGKVELDDSEEDFFVKPIH